MCAQSLNRVPLFVTSWTVAHQAPLSVGFPRQEYCSRLPFLSPGDLPDPGIKPRSPALPRFFTVWATWSLPLVRWRCSKWTTMWQTRVSLASWPWQRLVCLLQLLVLFSLVERISDWVIFMLGSHTADCHNPKPPSPPWNEQKRFGPKSNSYIC